MGIINSEEIRSKLKAVKKARALTVDDIAELLEKNNTPISNTTLYRFFGNNADAFNYEGTVRPLSEVLLAQGDVETASTDATKERIEGLLEIIDYKNEALDKLRKQYQERCKEYEARLDFLRDQIEKKDRRMDEKDEMIKKLLEKCL